MFSRYEYNSSNDDYNEDSDDELAESTRDQVRRPQKRKKNKGTQSQSGPPSLAGGGSIPEDPSNLTPKHHIRSPILEETESSIEAELKSQGRLGNERSRNFLSISLSSGKLLTY